MILKQLKEKKARRCFVQAFLFDTAEKCFIVVTGPLFWRDVFQLFMNWTVIRWGGYKAFPSNCKSIQGSKEMGKALIGN